MVKHTIRKDNDSPYNGTPGLDFYLCMSHDEEVELRAEDNRGGEWYILKIANNGKLSLAAGLRCGSGLELSNEGTIKINEDSY